MRSRERRVNNSDQSDVYIQNTFSELNVNNVITLSPRIFISSISIPKKVSDS